MAILIGGTPATIPTPPPPAPPVTPPVDPPAELSGPALRAARLKDYSFTVFWPFARFVRMIDDLHWLRTRIDDPVLAGHPLLAEARSDASQQHQDAVTACHGLVSDEQQASRLWESLSIEERAQYRCDEAWDVGPHRPDLIGVIWDTWAPGQFPEGWTLRRFLMLHENERPAYAAYRERGIIDTPVIVGSPTAVARAREIRKRKFANHDERMKR